MNADLAVTAHRSLSRITFILILAVVGILSTPASGVSQESPVSVRSGMGVALPVTAVNLFTSGVGYFQHDGVVDGEAEIALTFSSGDINDLLKSLVLQDFDGGTVEAVTYPSQDPLSRILASFSLDISDNPSLAQLINRARGERVSVAGAVTAEGVVSGVEFQARTNDSGTTQAPVLNLLTSEGLRQIAFSDIRTIRFSDPELQAELDSALAVIADNRQQDRKSVTIRFTGTGRRRVRIGYIRAVPVWKTSYRMVLDRAGDAQIQGWAIVENTGEVDWTDVSLGLVSGQPISFVMDLYTPIYTSRPRVEPDVAVSVAPQQYDRGVASAPAPAPSVASRSRAAESSAIAGVYADQYSFAKEESAPIDLSQGVSSAATLESGAVYRIALPVSIPRRGAAMIPIVARSVPVERISIYDRSVLADRPLQAIRVTNATGLQLPAGPATIFDGANYAGDARVPAMIDGEKRLLSYGVDLGTTVLVRNDQTPEEITQVRISGGTLNVTIRDRQTTDYVIDRVADDDASILLVHPKRSGWDVVSNVKPDEETDSSYRFETNVSAGATQTFTVAEERIRSQQFGLTTIRDDQIVYYLSNSGSVQAMDAQTKARLQRIQDLRATVAQRSSARSAIEQRVNDIYREQERIRSNLGVLDHDSDLYGRYLETLTSQEDQLLDLQNQLQSARDAETAARNALRDYIENL